MTPDTSTTTPAVAVPPADPRPAGADPLAPTDGVVVAAADVRFARLRRSPLVRRISGYSAGSVVAVFTSELAFAGAFGWLHTGNAWANLIGFVGGAVPNYFLNRRWAWKDRRGRSRRSEVLLYAAVSTISYLVSLLVTERTEVWTSHLTHSNSSRTLLAAAAYLAVSGFLFVAKFAAYELIVFTKGPGGRAGSSSRRGARSTTS